MRYRLISFALFLVGGLFFAHDAHALTISGGSTGAQAVHIGETSHTLSPITVTCTVNGEINGSWSVGFSPDISGLSFAAGSYTFSYEGDWNGGEFTAPTGLETDATSFTITKSVPACKVGDRLVINNLAVKYTGATTENKSHLYFHAGDDTVVSTESVAIDTKKPTLLSAVYTDTSPVDGIVDGIALTFSEAIAYSQFNSAHWSLNSSIITGLQITGIRSVSGAVLTLSATASVHQTGKTSTGQSNPSLTFVSQYASALTDSAGNSLTPFTSMTVEDGALPYVNSAALADSDGDGKIDQLDIIFSENVGITSLSSAVQLGLFTIVAEGFGSTLAPQSVTSVSATSVRYRLIEATTVKTGAGDVRVSYGGTLLADMASKKLPVGTISTVTTDRYPVLGEGIRPRAVSASPANGATSVATSGSFSVTFSEPMESATANYYIASGSVTGPMWSDNNTKATWNYSGWPGTTTFVVYVNSASAVAGTGNEKQLTGTVPYQFSFTTAAAVTPSPPISGIGAPSITVYSLSEQYGNEMLTKSRDVTVQLSASGATEMQVVNGTSFSSASWIGYQTSFPWTLTSGNAQKTVCVRFRNSTTTTASVCDNITYDSALEIPYGITFSIQADQPSTESQNVTLAIKASSAKWMMVSNHSNLYDGTWIAYAPSMNWSLPAGYGVKAVYIKFRSYDAIESAVYSDTIVYQGATAPGITVNAEALQPGDLVKLPSDGNPKTTGDSAVYYYGSDLKRYTFPNQKIYDAWFPSFDQVKMISPELMASIPLGGNMIIRPGTFLIKSPSLSKVYFVTPGGVLRPIKNEQVAKKLFGSTWGSLIVDMGDAFMVNYKFTGSELNEDSVHPDGAIIEANDKRYYIEAGTLHLFNDTGFSENGFQSRFLIRLPVKPNYSSGSGITSKKDQYSKFKKIQKDGSTILL